MSASVATSPKLLDQMRDKLRVMHYAWKTEKSYVAWVERFLAVSSRTAVGCGGIRRS